MTKKTMLIVIVGITSLVLTGNAFADHHGHGGGGHGWGRPWYGPGPFFWWAPEPVVIIPPPVSPVVIVPPTTVYVTEPVVAAPTTTVVKETVVQETVVLWIVNDNGSKTQITMKRTSDGGYRGPRGEYYATMPTEDQLKALYGERTVQAKPANFTVWIANDNGSQMPITLTPSGTGFVGPSNEYYATMPTQEQLKAMYGVRTNAPSEKSVTVWIDNTDGTQIPIVLIKEANEYVGPKGEHYAVVPSKDQLQMLYAAKAGKADTSNNTVVWFKNSDGTKTPITLQKDGSGYVGPAGERYASLPTEAQLKLLYSHETDSSGKNELSFEITKSDGTKTVVVLKKEGAEFVGPKGEHYKNMPTEEQLKLIYGK